MAQMQQDDYIYTQFKICQKPGMGKNWLSMIFAHGLTRNTLRLYVISCYWVRLSWQTMYQQTTRSLRYQAFHASYGAGGSRWLIRKLRNGGAQQMPM